MIVLAIWFEEHPYKIWKVMDEVLVIFTKCYINNIIVFNLILGGHVHHL
jgi:hypothetical protein